MKTIHATPWIRRAFLGLTLALAVLLLTIPLLTKGIAQVTSDPLPPEKLDIRPIPVPGPPQPLVYSEPSVVSTPAPPAASAPVPVAIAVPTPPASASRRLSSPPQPSRPRASLPLVMPLISRRGLLIMALALLFLLIWPGPHRREKLHSMHKECVG